MREKLDSILAAAAAEYGVSMDSRKADMFFEYMRLLLEWNAKFNLTGITAPDEIYIRHFADSLSIMPHIAESADLADIGSGAGFPGIPAAIARPDLNVAMIESTGKKVTFLNEAISRLGIVNARAYNGRAEDLGKDAAFRGRYGAVTARAVASLPVLIGYCLPFLKPGGIFVAMKGSKTDEIETSRGCIEKVVNFQLADGSGRNLVLIREISRNL